MPRKKRTEALIALDVGARIVKRPGLRPLYLELNRAGTQRRYNLCTDKLPRAIEAGREILRRVEANRWRVGGGGRDGALLALPDGTTKLADWSEDWIEDMRERGLAAHTVELNTQAARRFLAWLRDNQPRPDREPMLRDVTPDSVQRYLGYLRDSCGLSPATCNHHRRSLVTMFSRAIRKGLVEEGRNPVRLTDKVPEVKRIKPVPTEGEVARLLVAALEPVPNVGRGGKGPGGSFRDRSPLVHDVALLIVNSGLRLVEALTLRWDELDMTGGMYEGGTLYVRSKPENLIKDREERAVPLNDGIRALLLKRRQLVPKDCPWVFPTGGNKRQPPDPGTFRRDLSLAAKRAGIEPAGKVSAQALRRFFATANARTGMPPFVLKNLMGHASVSTTENHYVGGGAAARGWTPRSFGPGAVPASRQEGGA